MKNRYNYHKSTDRYWAVFYCFLALGLLCWALISKEYIYLLGAVIIAGVDFYWILKLLKKVS